MSISAISAGVKDEVSCRGTSLAAFSKMVVMGFPDLRLDAVADATLS